MMKLLEWGKSIGLTSLAALSPIKPLIIAIMILILFDLCTGLWRAVKIKEKITSNGLRRTITKIVAYQVAIICGFILETHIMGGLIPVTKIIASAIGVVELKSVLENLTKITGLDFWALLKDKLQGIKEVEKK